jgi:hypothetical protein
MSEQLEIIPAKEIQITKAQLYAAKFEGFKTSIAQINERTSVINYESPTDADAKLSRELRLEAVKVRTGALKEKDTLKESLLTEGNIIQSEFNLVKSICEETESKLAKVEKFREAELARLKEIVRTERTNQLKAYVDDTSIFPIAEMSQEAFDTLVHGQKLAYEARAEAFRKAEEERVAKEKEEAEAREAQRIENIRLKEEADKREKEIAEERAKADAERKKLEAKAAKEKADADAKLKAQKDANDKLQAEIKAKADAELKAKQEQEAKEKAEKLAKEKAEKEAAKAPDKTKLKVWVDSINGLQMPVLDSDDSQAIAVEILAKFQGFKKWANERIKDI